MVSLRSGISPAGVLEIFGLTPKPCALAANTRDYSIANPAYDSLSFASVYLLCVYRKLFYVEPQIQLIRRECCALFLCHVFQFNSEICLP